MKHTTVTWTDFVLFIVSLKLFFAEGSEVKIWLQYMDFSSLPNNFP